MITKRAELGRFLTAKKGSLGKTWSALNSIGLLFVAILTLWVGCEQNKISERQNALAEQQLSLSEQQQLIQTDANQARERAERSDRTRALLDGIRLLDTEFRLLKGAFERGPTTVKQMDDLLLELRPIRQKLESLAECITTEACTDDETTVGSFCAYASLYEGTVRAWLRDFGRGDLIGQRSYRGLYPECPDP